MIEMDVKPTAKKNVLLLIPEMCVGGAQRSLASLSVELARQYNVWLVVFNKDMLAPYTMGGELLSLDVFVGNSWLAKITSFYRRVISLKQLKRKLHIQASISFLEGADYVNILARENDKIIISIRGSKYHDDEISGVLGFVRLRLLMPLLYRLADKIVCVSHGIKAELKAGMGIMEDKLVVIHNFYDYNSLTTLTPADARTEEKFAGLFRHEVILSVGRLHQQKNFLGLLDVFARVVEKNPNLKLVIVGDGPERVALIEKAKRLNLSAFTDDGPLEPELQKVFFTGYQKPGAFLKHAKLFLLPSLWEGFPNALMEALAFGVPALSADCPTGPREILAPEALNHSAGTIEYADYGVLLPLLNSKESVDAWVSGILENIDNQILLDKYRFKGPQRFKQFSGDVVYPEWIKLLES